MEVNEMFNHNRGSAISTVSKLYEFEGEVTHAITGATAEPSARVDEARIDNQVTNESMALQVKRVPGHLSLVMAKGRRVRVTVEIL